MSAAVLAELLQLPRRQRLEIAERLWISAADDAKMPVPEAHKRLLRQRLADYQSGKIKAISHEELMKRVRTPLRASPYTRFRLWSLT